MALTALDWNRFEGSCFAKGHGAPAQAFRDLIDALVVEANASELELHTPVANLAALKALAAADLNDKMLILCETLGLYAYDSTSTATADDVNVVTPTIIGAGAGRFIRVALPTTVRWAPAPVADLAGLKAVAATDLYDRMLIYCDTLGLYQYDAASVATADDLNVVTPTAVGGGAGRFARLVANAENRAMLPAVADLAALKALTAAQRADMSLVDVDTLGVYKFDGASAATADDYQVVAPTVGSGRWLLQVPLSTPLSVAAPVADLATAKALPVAALAPNSLLWIKTLGLYWLNSTSAATADDVNVIQLTAEAGNARLIRLVPTAEPRHIHAPVADLAALKALAATDRTDNMVVFVDALGLYRFDAASAAAGDDYQVVVPTAGTGRWLLEAENLKPLKVASPVADLAAAKALPVAALTTRSLILIESLGLYWLDPDSGLTADDQTVIQLTAEVGNARLIRVAPASIPRAVHEPLADLAALKAVAAADRADNMVVFVDTLGVYAFDAASVVAGDDYQTVAPTVGTGRWHLQAEKTQPLKVSMPVADLAAVKALPVAALAPRGLILVESLGLYWLDPDSALVADDQNIIQLTAEVGNARLIRVAPPAENRAWHTPLADLAALKAVVAIDRADNMLVLVDTLGVYQFDAASVAAGDDDLVVVPTAGAGRWIMQVRMGFGPLGLRVIDLPCTNLGAGAHELGALHATKSCTVFDAKVVVRAAPTVGTPTVDVGSVAGAADGWLNGISTAVPGVISAANTWTVGAAITYLAATTWGAELADFLLGADAVTTGGHFDRVSLTLAANDPVEYTFPDAQTTTDISVRVFYCVNPS